MFLCAQLSRAGHECFHECGGVLALARAEQWKPDVIVAEVMMPDICGFEVCRRVRAHPELYQTPVIFMSTMAEEREVAHGLAQGADDYVIKPFDVAAFLGRMDGLLQTARTGLALDAVTHLPGPKALRYEVQHAISRNRPFGMFHAELLHLMRFSNQAGGAGRHKAVYLAARILRHLGGKLQSAPFFLAHMGAGHFVGLVDDPQLTRTYCERAAATWQKSVKELYADVGLIGLAADDRVANEILTLQFCATTSQSARAQSVQEYFDVLARLRTKVLTTSNGHIFIDNRHGA